MNTRTLTKWMLAAVCALCVSGLHAGISITSFNLENERVKAFVHNFTYSFADDSRIETYNISPPSRRDRPNPVTLEWTAQSGVTGLWVLVSNSSSFAERDSIALILGQTSCDIYNLVPGRTYYYKVMARKSDGSTITVDNSQFKTTGQVRMINASGCYNIRDLGGWPTASGFPIQYGKVFRGAELNGEHESNANGRKVLHDDLGIRADLDLRTASEARYIEESPLGSDVEYGFINLAHYYYDGIKNYAERFKPHMEFIFNAVKQGKPLYFHCVIGADRTGTTGFLLEGLLGVSESNIFKDYELTTFSGLNTTRKKDQIEDMMGYIKTLGGETLEENFFRYFVNKIGLDPRDVLEFKGAMLGHKFVHTLSTDTDPLYLRAGEQTKMSVTCLPADAFDAKLSYTSSDTLVAKVDAEGNITAVKGGTAVITISSYALKVDREVNVERTETAMPKNITYNGTLYSIASPNMISNGSFEYGNPFSGWTSGTSDELNADHFDIVPAPAGDSQYLRSKTDTDEAGSGSIRGMWEIKSGQTYVFSYRVKNTSGKTVTHNENLKLLLTNNRGSLMQGSGDDFVWDTDDAKSKPYSPAAAIVGADAEELILDYPSYDGNWTEITYVFTNTDGYAYCEMQFSHLSQDGDNTCLDDFYFAELGPPSTSDVNQDGQVNSADVVTVYNFIQHGEKSGCTMAQADVNADESVNAADVVAIYNTIIGK